jgi:hypothetical protein
MQTARHSDETMRKVQERTARAMLALECGGEQHASRRVCTCWSLLVHAMSRC